MGTDERVKKIFERMSRPLRDVDVLPTSGEAGVGEADAIFSSSFFDVELGPAEILKQTFPARPEKCDRISAKA